eukprot:3389922-Rhodomonas_salina.1
MCIRDRSTVVAVEELQEYLASLTVTPCHAIVSSIDISIEISDLWDATNFCRLVPVPRVF